MQRFLGGLSLVTCLSLVYVQQRISLVTLGYQVESLRHKRDDLLDQHRVLNYNVLTLQSPMILNKRLERQSVQLTVPQHVEVVHHPGPPVLMALQGEESVARGPSWLLQEAKRMAGNWLEMGRQAEAKPVLEER